MLITRRSFWSSNRLYQLNTRENIKYMDYSTPNILSWKNGNNALSWDQRKEISWKEPTLFIPQRRYWTVDDISIGENIVFEECIDGKIVSCRGLDTFIEFDYHHEYGTTRCIVFDNHNHALYFWLEAVRAGLVQPGFELIHIDEHSDLWENPHSLDLSLAIESPAYAYEFTNSLCNVGNYIVPAQRSGLVGSLIRIENEYQFEQYETYTPQENSILNLYLDIFSEELDFIPEYIKVSVTKRLLKRNKYATIATSPYFIDQWLALQKLRKILHECE